MTSAEPTASATSLQDFRQRLHGLSLKRLRALQTDKLAGKDGKPASTIRDPAVPGLYWRRIKSKSGRYGVYAEFRWTNPDTKKRGSRGLGPLPSQEEIEAKVQAAGMAGAGADMLALEPIRNKARALRAKLMAGGDPASDIGAAGRTLRQALAVTVEDMEKRGLSPLSVKEYEHACEVHLKDWLDTPLRRITGEMVRERHAKIGKRVGKGGGKGAANKTFRAFRAVYNTAAALAAASGNPEDTLPPNPTVVLRRAWFDLAPRKRALRTRDLETFGKELETLRSQRFGTLRADFVAFLLLTGMRETAAMRIERAHVDPTERAIFIPSPKGGARRAFTLPLSDQAWEIVEQRLAASNSRWLFPSPSKPGRPISDVRVDGAFSPWADAAGEPISYTHHGMRATFKSMGLAAGVPDPIVRLLSNSKLRKGDAHEGYISPDDIAALRAASQRITDYMRGHGLRL